MSRYLDFVKDEDFENCMENILRGYDEQNKKKSDKQDQLADDILKRSEQSVDQFKFLFDVYKVNKSLNQWKDSEICRQIDKSVTNISAKIHVCLLSHVEGWEYLDKDDVSDEDYGPVLKKEDNSIFIDLDNKHNTTTGKHMQKLRDKLQVIHKKYPEADVYYGYIVSKDYLSRNEVWVWKKEENPKIRKVYGAALYELVTRDPDAMKKTLNAIKSYLEGHTSHSFSDEDENLINEYIKYTS